MTIINAAALVEQQILAQARNSKQKLGGTLEKALTQIYSMNSYIDMFKTTLQGNALTEAWTLGEAAAKQAKALARQNGNFLLTLKKAREDVEDKIMMCIDVVKTGPGGFQAQQMHFKNLLADGVKEIRTLQAAEEKLWQKISAEEKLIASQAVAQMKEAIRKQRSKTSEVDADIRDRKEGLMSRIRAALADVKSYVAGVATGNQFAAEGSEASLSDMLEKDARFRRRLNNYEKEIVRIAAKTKREALSLISTLSTTSQKNAALRKIERLFGLEKGMATRASTAVGQGTDMVDGLFAQFSKGLKDSADLLVPLRGVVTGQKNLAIGEMSTLKQAVEGDEDVAKKLIDEAADVANELDKQVGARRMAMEDRFKKIRSKLTALQGASSWQGSGMLEREDKQLNELLHTQQALKNHIRTVIEPKNAQWRNGVSDILQRMSLYEDQMHIGREAREADSTPRRDLLRYLKDRVRAKHAGVMKQIDGLDDQLSGQLLSIHGQQQLHEAQTAERSRALRLQIARTIQPTGLGQQQYALMGDQFGAALNATRDRYRLKAAAKQSARMWQSDVDRMSQYAPEHGEESIRAQLAALKSSFLEADAAGHARDFRAVEQELRALDESRDAELAQLDEGLERMQATQSS